MSRTKRIYNNPNLKKTVRFNIDENEHYNGGIPFTKRSRICMGECPMCRDPKKEPKVVRRKNKNELRFELKKLKWSRNYTYLDDWRESDVL